MHSTLSSTGDSTFSTEIEQFRGAVTSACWRRTLDAGVGEIGSYVLTERMYHANCPMTSWLCWRSVIAGRHFGTLWMSFRDNRSTGIFSMLTQLWYPLADSVE